MKKRILTYFLCVAMLTFHFPMDAQGNSDGKGRNPPNSNKPPPPHPELPIDGGLSYLLLAGLTLGIYQIRRKKS
jgi:hypothetical protein